MRPSLLSRVLLSPLLLQVMIAILVVNSAFSPSATAQQQGRGFQLAPSTRSSQQIATDASDINKWGGNMVRYPIYLTNDPVLTNWINRIKSLLATTEPKGVTVAITFLWPDRSVPGSEIRDVNQFISDWGDLATSLKQYKNIWYDLANEPVNSDWGIIALKAAQRIRSIDSVHPVIYATPGSTIGNVDQTYHPLSGISNQVLEVHFYDWPNMQFFDNVSYGTGVYTRKNLFLLLNKASSAAKTYGIPGYVGEIAIRNTNPSASAFLRDAMLFSSILNLNLTIHAFRESSQWDYEQNPSALQEIKQWLDRFNADLDLDGQPDSINWNSPTGNWYYRLSSENFGIDHVTQWGLPGDKPFVGDFNGDGKQDFAVYRSGAVPMWYVLYDYKKGWGQTNNYAAIQWGLDGDTPVAADYDGNGTSQIAVWRPSNGSWYIKTGSSSYYVLQWGLQNDTAFPKDYDGDNIVDPAVWRTSILSYYFIPSSGVCPNGSHTHWIGCEVIL